MKRFLIVVAACLVTPAAASASSVHVGKAPQLDYPHIEYRYSPQSYSFVYYDAAPGEANRLSIDYEADETAVVTVTLTDPGATIHAGHWCTSLGPHKARCRNTVGVGHYIEGSQARLGDGDDKVQSTKVQALASEGGTVLYGGTGDDVLMGTRQIDLLAGGGGRDRLFGGASGDVLTDGDRSGAADSDLLDGGPHDDLVSYRARTGDVKVDLASDAPAGEDGENDAVRHMEEAQGGSGDDELLGTDAENYLYGEEGADLLVGHGDWDHIHAGPGRDNMRGGDGPDFIWPEAGRDVLSCGAGKDIVIGPEAGENLRGPCEAASWTFYPGGLSDFPGVSVFPYATAVSRRAIKFRVGCPYFDDDGANVGKGCSGELFVRVGGRRIGRGHANPGAFGNRPTRVRLNRRGRKLVRRHRSFLATMVLDYDSIPKVAWTARIRR